MKYAAKPPLSALALIALLALIAATAILVVLAVHSFGADPVKLEIGKAGEVTITVPTIKRTDLIDIISTFLARGTKTEEEFRKALEQSPHLTLILTTK